MPLTCSKLLQSRGGVGKGCDLGPSFEACCCDLSDSKKNSGDRECGWGVCGGGTGSKEEGLHEKTHSFTVIGG